MEWLKSRNKNMKIDLKRLHKVHNNYPNNKKGEGKTTYCLDSLLRAAQTGYYKNLCYVTNTERATEIARKEFIDFLIENEQFFMWDRGELDINGTTIKFSTKAREDNGRLCRYDGYIVDYFVEDRSYTPEQLVSFGRRIGKEQTTLKALKMI